MLRDSAATSGGPTTKEGAASSEYNLAHMDNKSFHFANPIYDLESSMPEHSGAAHLETDRKPVPDSESSNVTQPGSAVIGKRKFT